MGYDESAQPPAYTEAGPSAPPPQPVYFQQPQAAPPQMQYQAQMQPVAPQQVNLVVQQPQPTILMGKAEHYSMTKKWHSSLCGCFDDMGNCLFTLFCGPCALCMAASAMNESVCIVCCVPMALMAMRTKVRHMYGIRGSICDDCVVTSFCTCCAQCQLQHQISKPVKLTCNCT